MASRADDAASLACLNYCENDYCANVMPCSVHPLRQLVDVHIHLLDPSFDSDRELLLEKARSAGVTALTVVSETVDQVRGISVNTQRAISP